MYLISDQWLCSVESPSPSVYTWCNISWWSSDATVYIITLPVLLLQSGHPACPSSCWQLQLVPGGGGGYTPLHAASWRNGVCCCVADLLNTCAGLSLDTGSAPHKGYMSPPSFWAACTAPGNRGEMDRTSCHWIVLFLGAFVVCFKHLSTYI